MLTYLSAGMKKELRAMHEAFLYVMATRKMHVLARVHLTTANQRIELAKRVLSADLSSSGR